MNHPFLLKKETKPNQNTCKYTFIFYFYLVVRRQLLVAHVEVEWGLFSGESVLLTPCSVQGDLIKEGKLCCAQLQDQLVWLQNGRKQGSAGVALQRRPIWEIHFVCILPKYTTNLLELKQKHEASCFSCTQTYHKTVWFRVGSEILCNICFLGIVAQK